ncbi:helix-turn-helix domain-containing protein [Derxia gummosa]|uniref:Helix-turn-helix domain-containing protein n=1 Tax=Derxia gummosa DSM 723 TaxID=1121388 RepID=A0A9U5CTB9_9BURK|nr:helix-turn-helix domain-containing protein [Derxia gummosa]
MRPTSTALQHPSTAPAGVPFLRGAAFVGRDGAPVPRQQPFSTRRIRAHDADEHARNLSGWDQEYDQLAPGSFDGELAEFWIDSVQVFRERTSHAVRQTCRIRDDAIWCGIPVVHDGTRIEGRTVGADGVMLRAGGSAFELLTPSSHDIFGVVAGRDALEGYADAIGCRIDAGRLAGPGWWQVGEARRAQALLQLGALLDGALANGVWAGAAAGATDAGLPGTAARHRDARPAGIDAPAGPMHDAARRQLQQSVLDVLVGLLEAPTEPPRGHASFARRQQLVRAICDAVRAEPDAVPTVPELCQRFHVSRRALQYAFEEVLGASPVVWLRTLRLNAVRRRLREAAVGARALPGADAAGTKVGAGTAQHGASIGDIASAHGFWNLSQFSTDYRKLFGERPSQTLGR